MPKIVTAPTQRVTQNESITLAPDLGGEAISNAVWSSLEGDLAISGESFTSTEASAFIQGDTPGMTYALCRATTSTGRIEPLVVKIKIIPLTTEE